MRIRFSHLAVLLSISALLIPGCGEIHTVDPLAPNPVIRLGDWQISNDSLSAELMVAGDGVWRPASQVPPGLSDTPRWYRTTFRAPDSLGARDYVLEVAAAFDGAVWIDGFGPRTVSDSRTRIVLPAGARSAELVVRLVPRDSSYFLLARAVALPSGAGGAIERLQGCREYLNDPPVKHEAQTQALRGALDRSIEHVMRQVYVPGDWVDEVVARLEDIGNAEASEEWSAAVEAADLAFVHAETAMEVEPVYLTPPYLRNVRADRAAIVWETSAPVEARVRWWKVGAGRRRTLEVPHRSRLQRAVLEGLEPGTMYKYRVVAGDRTSTTIDSFRTAPAEPEAFTFAVESDAVSGRMMSDRVAAHAWRLNADFSVNLAMSGRPGGRGAIYTCSGMDTLSDGDGSPATCGFEYDGAHFTFLTLDGTAELAPEAFTNSESYRQFVEDLEGARDAEWKFVALCCRGPGGEAHAERLLWNVLLPAMDDAQVDICFIGWRGESQLTRSRTRLTDAGASDGHGFREVRVDGDRLELWTHRVDWDGSYGGSREMLTLGHE